MTRTDKQLQLYVQAELGWEPSLDSAAIGVAAHDGVVILSGHVGSYSEKVTAEESAKRVAGVRGIANELKIRLSTSSERDDQDIADAAVHLLKWSTLVPADRVQVTVSGGFVKLEGEVDWNYQREAAYRKMKELTGVLCVTNEITVKPRAAPAEVRSSLEAALERNAGIDARRISIDVDDAAVTLRGTVPSWRAHDQAARAAWSAPGVTGVKNLLRVEEEAFAPL